MYTLPYNKMYINHKDGRDMTKNESWGEILYQWISKDDDSWIILFRPFNTFLGQMVHSFIQKRKMTDLGLSWTQYIDKDDYNNGGLHEYDPYLLTDKGELIIDEKWFFSLSQFAKNKIVSLFFLKLKMAG